MATLLLKLKGRELQSMAITKTRTTIGRDPTCDLTIDNTSVSRLHARIDYVDGGFVVTDEQSANGIFINGRQVASAPLINGAEVHIGKFTVTFLALGGVAPDRLAPPSEVVPGSVDVGETTLLDDDYKEKLRQGLDRARVSTDPVVRKTRERKRGGNRVLWLAVVILGVVVAVLAVMALGG